jgi:hypothetical protein
MEIVGAYVSEPDVGKLLVLPAISENATMCEVYHEMDGRYPGWLEKTYR